MIMYGMYRPSPGTDSRSFRDELNDLGCPLCGYRV
jgi:hypothetical protein